MECGSTLYVGMAQKKIASPLAVYKVLLKNNRVLVARLYSHAPPPKNIQNKLL